MFTSADPHLAQAPETVMMFFRVNPKKIVDLKSLLEGYEGLLVVRTHDPQNGIVQLLVSPDFQFDAKRILENLSQWLWMEAVPCPLSS